MDNKYNAYFNGVNHCTGNIPLVPKAKGFLFLYYRSLQSVPTHCNFLFLTRFPIIGLPLYRSSL